MPKKKKKTQTQTQTNSKELIESRVNGVVKQYTKGDSRSAHGFITVYHTSRNAFFHISEVLKDNRRLGDPIRVGDEVIFDLYLAPKGYRAESVQILTQDGEDFCNENLYHRRDSGIGSTRQREGNGGGSGDRKGRRQRRDGRDHNRRGEGSWRGHEWREDDLGGDGGWGWI